MKPSTLFLSSAVVALAAAATLAPNLPDGSYHVFTDKDGVEYHTQLSSATNDNLPLLSWTHDPSNSTFSIPDDPFSQSEDLGEHFDKRCSGIPWTEAAVWCGCGWTLVPSDCDQAVQGLKNQVASQPGGVIYPKWGNAWYTVHGYVVAFQCVWADLPQWSTLTVNDITVGMSLITESCGYYISGTTRLYQNGGYNNYDLGYMQYKPGTDFCGTAEASARDCC